MYSVLGKRVKVDGDVLEVYRYKTADVPIMGVQRFVFGAWRDRDDSTLVKGTKIADLIGEKQRGLLVELPKEWAEIEKHAAIERLHLSLPESAGRQMHPEQRVDANKWRDVLMHSRQPEPIVTTITRFTLGGHSWWIVESGCIASTPGIRNLLERGNLIGATRAALFSVEPAARKTYAQMIEALEPGRFSAMFKSSSGTVTLPGDREIAEALAAEYREQHEVELRQIEAQKKRDAEAKAALEREEAARREAEAERQRKIASGDVSVLDNSDLAVRLRQKRLAKGS